MTRLAPDSIQYNAIAHPMTGFVANPKGKNTGTFQSNYCIPSEGKNETKRWPIFATHKPRQIATPKIALTHLSKTQHHSDLTYNLFKLYAPIVDFIQVSE